MLSNAESRSLARRFSTDLLTESKVSELSTAELAGKTWGDAALIALESAQGDESRYANCLASVLRELDMSERHGGGKRSRVALVAAPSCSIKRNVLWNFKTTTLFGIPSRRTRSSFSNRNVHSVVFRFWRAQSKN
jgi:hypothetical protein